MVNNDIFTHRKRFEDSSNQAVVTVLFKEAERLNLKMSLFQIRGMFQTQCIASIVKYKENIWIKRLECL